MSTVNERPIRESIAEYIRWHADRELEKHLRLHPDSFWCVMTEKLRDLANRIELEEDKVPRFTPEPEEKRKKRR